MFNNKVVIAVVLVIFVVALVGCMTHTHTIGKGAQTGQKVEKRAWYALWGLIPISPVDAW